jgi:hypothetical protein
VQIEIHQGNQKDQEFRNPEIPALLIPPTKEGNLLVHPRNTIIEEEIPKEVRITNQINSATPEVAKEVLATEKDRKEDPTTDQIISTNREAKEVLATEKDRKEDPTTDQIILATPEVEEEVLIAVKNTKKEI